jgi:N-acetyl-beta-hexosaminidase
MDSTIARITFVTQPAEHSSFQNVLTRTRDTLASRSRTHVSICPQVVAAGYSVIQSQGWYLSDIHLQTNWSYFYWNEPMDGITDPAQQARVLGGEACAWGEYIDGSALLNTAWPRTAAVAERLWSPRSYTSVDEARPRLAAFRCLLEARGIPAGRLDTSVASP